MSDEALILITIATWFVGACLTSGYIVGTGRHEGDGAAERAALFTLMWPFVWVGAIPFWIGRLIAMLVCRVRP